MIPLDFAKVAGLAPETDMTFAQESYEVFARMGLLLQGAVPGRKDDGGFAPRFGSSGEGARAQRPRLASACTSFGTSSQSLLGVLASTNAEHPPQRRVSRSVDQTDHGGKHEVRFQEGSTLQQAGWHHIAHALSAELDVLDDLLASPTLEQMGLVPDRFAFLLDNGYLPRRNMYVS